MRLKRQSNGEGLAVTASLALGAGGEARIYAVPPERRLVAKVYHRPDGAQARKLAAMLANPPEDPMAAQGHISIAWPVDLLYTEIGVPLFAGYLMPYVTGTRPLFYCYNPSTRRKHCPLFSYQYLHRTARNLAAAVRALHSRGYVIGDINESNILVTDTALVTLVDTDSFQVRDPQNGAVYRCPVGKPEFTPPELQGQPFARLDRQPEHDLFGLAVLIFLLLMEGTHPFAGVYQGVGDPPPYEDRIRAGHFPYGAQSIPYRPMPSAPSPDLLQPTLRQLFLRCFEDGHRRPLARPDAQTWLSALIEAEAELISCAVNPRHSYGWHLDACPWCERARRLGGRDPFPPRPEPAAEKTPSMPPSLPGSGRRPPISSPPITGSPPSLRATAGGAIAATGPGAGIAFSVPPSASATLTPPASTLQFPRNVWAWAALGCALIALMSPTQALPTLNVLAGLASVVCGLAAWRRAVRASVGGLWLGAGASVSGAAMALTVLPGMISAVAPGNVRTLTMPGVVRSVAFSPDGATLATTSNRVEDQRLIGGELDIWVTQTGRKDQTLADFRGNIVAAAYAPDGKTLAVGLDAPLEAGQVILMDAEIRGKQRALPGYRDHLNAIAYASDGQTVASGGPNSPVELWDVPTGTLRRSLPISGDVYDVVFSPDNRLLAVGSGASYQPGAVRLYNVQTGQLIWERHGHGNGVLAVAFSPDGRLLASSGGDSTIQLWNVKTGARVRTLEGQGYQVAALAFSPDSRLLASGSNRPGGPQGEEGEVDLWEVAQGKQLRSLTGHSDGVDAVAFAPNGKLLASGSRDHTVKLWRLP